MRSIAGAMKILVLILIFTSGLSKVIAATPTLTSAIVYVNDLSSPPDKIGKIGDEVHYTVVFESISTLGSPTAHVILPGIVPPNSSLRMMSTPQLLGGDTYSAFYIWTVDQGTTDYTGAPLKAVFGLGNPDGYAEIQSPATYTIDNVRPNRDGPLLALIDNTENYINQPVKKGQEVKFTQKMLTSDTNQVATLNLSATGLIASNTMASDGALIPTFTLPGVVFPAGLDGAYNLPLNIVDGRGNISFFNDFNMNIDTRPPFVATCTVENTAGRFVPALPGHFIKFYLKLQSFDNDTVKITCPGFANGAPPIALPSLTSTDPTTYEATLLLDENPNVYGNQYQFFYEITDNAGNVTVATATLFSIDLVLPSQSNAGVIVYPPAPATTVSTLDDIASASTRLQFKTDIVSSDTLNVTVNLTALGGPASYPLQLTTSPTINLKTYIGTYTVILPPPASNATPIDGNWMNFTIYGKAPSGNLVFKTTTPDIFIDNVLPDITALTFTRPGDAAPPIIAGDVVIVQATVSGVNEPLGGQVWVDLTALGGLAQTPLDKQTDTIWRTTINVATGSFDITKFFRATAWDDGRVKNQDVFDTDAILVDTEPPVLILATYTSIPAQGTDHPFVISGDVVKFQVELASTVTNVPYDAQTVTINLTSAGGAAAQVMTLQPSGLYTYDFTVPNNNLLTNGATFPLVIRDNAGNLPIASTTGLIVYPVITINNFDQGQPVISAFTVTRNAGAGTIRIGDSVTFSATVTGVREFEGGTVWADLRAIGGLASTTFINNAGNWSVTIPAVASGSLDTASHIFTVFAYNRPENQVSRNSAATNIDIEPPVLDPPSEWLGQIATWSVTPPLGGAHTHVNNGDLLKFEVRLASSTLNTPFDSQTVFIDLSSAGGNANQAMTLLTSEIYTCTFTVPLGTLTDGATFPLIIRDIPGNGPYNILNGVASQSISPLITVPMFDQAVPVISSFTLTRDAGPATIHIDDAVTFRATIDGVLAGGVVWSDFSGIGVTNSASYTYTKVSGNIWQAKVTIGSGSIDANNATFTVYAYNRIDHQTSFGSQGYAVDNIPPFLVIATYTSFPAQSATRPYVRIGDDITLTVTLDPPNDGHSVSVDLTALGSGTASLTPTVPGGATFTLTFPLATGTTNTGVTLPVTIRDNAANAPFDSVNRFPIVASITIALLDQLPPTINTFTVTRDAGAGIILLNDAITFNASVTNVEPATGAVWLDLSRLGGPALATFTNTSVNNWQLKHVVGTGTTGLPSIDQTDYIFNLVAYDKASNTFSLNSSPTNIDNIAPEMFDPLICTWKQVLPRKNADYMIIGDKFNIEVQLKLPDDGHIIQVDLSSLGNLGTQTLKLINSATGYYKTEFPIEIATGPLNLGATFPITIRDNAGNRPVFSPVGGPASSSFDASATIELLDQNPPDPGILGLTVTRRNNEIADSLDNKTFINIHQFLKFNLPYTAETGFDDHATATIDLQYVPSQQNLVFVDPNISTIPETLTTRFARMDETSGAYYLDFDTASLTTDLHVYPYQFTATMYDRSGNKAVTQSVITTKYRVDCYPPEIASISVAINEGETAHTGSVLNFRVQAKYNVDQFDGGNLIRPVLDLTNLGEVAPIIMEVSTPAQWYQYQYTVPEGSFDGTTLTSWVITLQDGGRNFVASHTNAIAIDNMIPQVIGNMTVDWTDTQNDHKIKLDDLVTFTISLKSGETPGTATLDLTAVGGPLAATMTRNIDSFSLATTTLLTSLEYSNYSFKAVVTDLFGNSTNVESDPSDPSKPIISVDCQPASFSNHGIAILQTNGDNPLSNVSNINDVLVVFASISASLDAVASATISSGTTFIATGTMTFNAANNRHEALFTVGSNSSNWGGLNLNAISYYLSAIDDAGNTATPAASVSTFKVKNLAPNMASHSMWLSPNMVREFEGTNYLLNVASGSVVDLLLASATLANDATVTSGWLNLSAIPGAPAKVPLNSISGSTASNTTGINLASYAKLDKTTVEFSVTLLDEAGNPATASQTFVVDTKQPAIETAKFDGTMISVSCSEDIFNSNINMWRLVGSNTVPVGSMAKLELSTYATGEEGVTYYYLNLNTDGRKEVAQWASTPVYLEILATDTAPLTDHAGNWLPKASYYPITITDSNWREPARINSMVMTHNWPNSIVIDFYFNKPMATATSLVASDAVLFVDTPTGVVDPFNQVDYRYSYSFQASDTVSWSDDKTMRIVMCSDGRDWIARKLGNGSKTLKFAQRNNTRRFLKDDLDKPLTYYAYNSPVIITDNRIVTPVPGLDVLDAPVPVLNLASGSLTIQFSDRALLFKDNYAVSNNSLLPSISEPAPTDDNALNSFKNRIHLHNTVTETFITLECENLSASANGLASTVATLKLTAADITRILNFYTSSSNPAWGLKIDAGAFANLWGMSNNVYLPLGPGNLTVGTMTSDVPAAVQACAVSDMAPTRENTGNFIFEFELSEALSNGVAIPFASAITPRAAIFRQDNDNRLASGTFTGWTTRTVNGTTRTIASFKTAEAFQSSTQLVPAYVELFGVEDIFDNPITGLVASYAYNRADRITTGANGFSTASAAMVMDNVMPTVVTISPADAIGVANPGSGLFYVDFSETMDTTSTPVLSLATSGAALSFSFAGWSVNNTRASYNNIQAITVDTPNGTWTYTLTGGLDTAGNAHTITTRQVQILSNAPPVAQGGLILRAAQNTISAGETFNDQPFSFAINPTAVLSITYQKIPTENLPHRVRFYNSAGTLIGSSNNIPFTGGLTATSTFSGADFTPALGMTGPTTITVKMIDSAGNETGSLKEIVHDSSSPILTSLTLTGMATISAGIHYYNNISLGNMTANVVCSNATDQMRLTIASSSLLATETFPLTHLGTGNYQGSFGTTLKQAIYAIGITDAAGNLHTGAGYTALVVDNSAPTVTAIVPNTVIGNTPATLATFTVTFSEPMEPSAIPTLTLATPTVMPIYMDFAGWVNPNIATTALFVNRFDIGTTYPSGNYNYRVDGGSDLAGNALNFAPTVPFTVDVQSQGPAAALKIYTMQPDIFGTTVLENAAYSTLVNSSASIQLTYNSGPFNTPHQIRVYNPAGTYVATLSLDASNVATFPGNLAGWLNGTGPDIDGFYSFKLMDVLGNIAPASGYMNRKLYLDRASATVTAFNFNDGGNGIATSGIIYYSSAVAGSATVTLTTLATDSLRLVASGTATYTFDLASSTTTHTGKFGGSLPEGLYQVSVADFAGNFSTGATASAMIVVDNDKPAVISAIPALTVGAVPAGSSTFVITFDEAMNTNIAPSVRLATSTKEVQLLFTSWIDEFSCRLAPNSDINGTFPAGTYSYIISNAKDRAGNIATATTPGSFTVGVYARGPLYTATLTSQQNRVSTETVLLNQPFSPLAEPGIATLTITYSEGPFSKPHQIKLYDSGNVEVNTINLADSGTGSIASITAAFFNNHGAVNAKAHKFRVVDSLGNLSATASLNLVYDAVAPEVATLTLSNISANSSKPVYYHNPALHGNLVTTAETTSASDPLRLLMTTGIATSTWKMTSTVATPFKHSYTMTSADNSVTALPDGNYGVTIVDAAGNFATGAASTAVLVIDRAAPLVNVATISNGLYLSSGPAGAATFTLTFNEALSPLATPTLSIATSSQSISCICVSYAANQAVFTTSMAVTNKVTQGDYVYRVKATDMTGNIFDSATGTVQVRSRGPVIAMIRSESQQATTASGSETLVNQPFSFLVAPGVATLSVQLTAAPDGNPGLVYLHYTLEGNTMASYPLALTGNAATFTWSLAQGPQPVTPTSYVMYLVDTNGDFSLENLVWRLDNATPTVNDLTFTGGENNAASATIYFNPFRHPSITPRFQAAAETEAPRMRVRGQNSTDTYELTAAGTGFWSTSFSGISSRSTARLADGKYDIGLVDKAGNLAASGSENLYSLVIDSQSPTVSTYSMYVASQPVSIFSPSAGNLDVFVVSTDALTATGVYYLEIYNIGGTRIGRLPLVASAGAYLASWDGRNDQGNLVVDGDYTFKTTDYAGNTAATTTKVKAITSEFKATGATQISSMSAKIWFNQELYGSSVKSSSVTASPAMTISSVIIADSMSISFNTATAFSHGVTYTFTVASDSTGVRSIYGASLTGTGNQVSMTADGQGPLIASHNFTGLTSQKEFFIVFDEAYSISTAGIPAAYTLRDSNGNLINISQAVTQTDQKSVKLVTDQILVENQSYTIVANGVTDTLGNPSPAVSYQFQGRDLTAPVITVSAFSNPANENDIIVLATSNEPLKTAPTLYVKHGSASTVSSVMQARSGNQVFMAGVSLNPANGGTGSLVVRGADVSGNEGSGEGTFSIAYVSASLQAQILSADGRLQLNFAEDSLKSDATVKILQHELINEESGNGLIMASMQKELRAARGLKFSQLSSSELQNSAELVPMTEAYEISIAGDKIDKGFSIAFTAPVGTSTTGLGLFNQNGNTWKFITSDLNQEMAYSARLTSSQMLAVMRDVVAPAVALDNKINLDEPFRVSRPEFSGEIKESGSGLAAQETVAHIDGGLAQPVTIDSLGRFSFKPMAELTTGDHELVIKAADQTGNRSQTAAMRFQVQLPLQIGQIMQYPNPASRRGYIRISANSGALNDDLVSIKIYDTAGHKVTTLSNVKAVKENYGAGNSRYLYDILWDLRNDAGKQVANGVYLARIEVRDPINPATKVKKTCKLAVLR